MQTEQKPQTVSCQNKVFCVLTIGQIQTSFQTNSLDCLGNRYLLFAHKEGVHNDTATDKPGGPAHSTSKKPFYKQIVTKEGAGIATFTSRHVSFAARFAH